MSAHKKISLTLTLTLASEVSTDQCAMSPQVGEALAGALVSCGFNFTIAEHDAQLWTITDCSLLRSCHA